VGQKLREVGAEMPNLYAETSLKIAQAEANGHTLDEIIQASKADYHKDQPEGRQ